MSFFSFGRVIPGLLLVANVAYSEPAQFYTLADFEGIRKVDAHVHINSSSSGLAEVAEKLHFQLITINVDYPAFPPVEEQYLLSLAAVQEAPDTLAFAGTFTMDNWDDSKWQKSTIQQIERVRKNGAVAIKVWKNIGMKERDEDGNLIMVDDDSLSPVFDYMARHHIPLIGHQAEPKNCWLPVSEMTALNDKTYFANHPEYHMYKHPEMPSYEDHMAHRDSMLKAHPGLEFVGAHVASLEWSVKRLSQFLDRFPNARVDLAARMGQIQYQSQRNYQQVRDFFIAYASRLIYATDLTQSQGQTVAETMHEAEQVWRSDWQYLTSDNTMSSAVVDGTFTGLKLPKNVVDKIYYRNALTQFPEAFGMDTSEGKSR